MSMFQDSTKAIIWSSSANPSVASPSERKMIAVLQPDEASSPIVRYVLSRSKMVDNVSLKFVLPLALMDSIKSKRYALIVSVAVAVVFLLLKPQPAKDSHRVGKRSGRVERNLDDGRYLKMKQIIIEFTLVLFGYCTSVNIETSRLTVCETKKTISTRGELERRTRSLLP